MSPEDQTAVIDAAVGADTLSKQQSNSLKSSVGEAGFSDSLDRLKRQNRADKQYEREKDSVPAELREAVQSGTQTMQSAMRNVSACKSYDERFGAYGVGDGNKGLVQGQITPTTQAITDSLGGHGCVPQHKSSSSASGHVLTIAQRAAQLLKESPPFNCPECHSCQFYLPSGGGMPACEDCELRKGNLSVLNAQRRAQFDQVNEAIRRKVGALVDGAIEVDELAEGLRTVALNCVEMQQQINVVRARRDARKAARAATTAQSMEY
jgi:hypothetical protein